MMSSAGRIGAILAMAILTFSCGGGGGDDGDDNVQAYNYYGVVTNLGGIGTSAFRLNMGTGALTEVAGSPFAFGSSPYVAYSAAADPTGRFVYIANWHTNNVSACNINSTTGGLTEIIGSPYPAGAAPRAIAVEPKGEYLYVVNSGSANVSAFAIDPIQGTLTEVAGSPFPASSSPWSVAVHPTGPFVYVINKETGDVSAYRIDSATGALTEIAGSPFFVGSNSQPAAVCVRPDGKYVYVLDTWYLGNIAIFGVDTTTGALTAIGGSPGQSDSAPWAIAVRPDGKFAYVVYLGKVGVYEVRSDGLLSPLSGSPFDAGPGGFSVAIDPTGKFMYLGNEATSCVYGFSLDSDSGRFTALAGPPASTLYTPASVTILRVAR